MPAVDFTKLIDNLVDNDEGGWWLTQNANDPDGGWTYAGVTRKVWEAYTGLHTPVFLIKGKLNDTPGVVRQIAYDIYVDEYCIPLMLEKLPEYIHPALLSCAVNCGLETAVKILQTACNCFPQFKIPVDGVLGPHTLDTVHDICDDMHNTVSPLNVFLCEWMRHYINLVQENAKAWEDHARFFHAIQTKSDQTIATPKGFDFLKQQLPTVNRATSLEGWFNRVERYRR